MARTTARTGFNVEGRDDMLGRRELGVAARGRGRALASGRPSSSTSHAPHAQWA
jgi:hypothetical protein